MTIRNKKKLTYLREISFFFDLRETYALSFSSDFFPLSFFSSTPSRFPIRLEKKETLRSFLSKKKRKRGEKWMDWGKNLEGAKKKMISLTLSGEKKLDKPSLFGDGKIPF